MVPEELHLPDGNLDSACGSRDTPYRVGGGRYSVLRSMLRTKTLRDGLENHRQVELRNIESFSRFTHVLNRNGCYGIGNGHLTRRARNLSCFDGWAQNLTPRTRCKYSSRDCYKRFSSTDHRQGAQATSSNYQRSVPLASPFEQENGGDEA